MREILFRGKRKDSRLWEVGDLATYTTSDKVLHTFINGFEYEVHPETVGQYTGLTDKNGTKIFEGDIVSAHNYLGYIAMDSDYWEIHWNNANFARGLYIWASTVEVVGNIQDNHELLKEC